jgi:aromatic amino acid aminotransferase I
MFLQRRKDIYKVCQKHDIIILEDEPYYFLQMEKYGSPPSATTDLLSTLIPSFMSLDVDGRVLRLDSLSKVPSIPIVRLIVDCCSWSPSSMALWPISIN